MSWRYNADVDIRELERRAASGDPAAAMDLAQARFRVGDVAQGAAELLVSAGPEVLRHLPGDLRIALFRSVMFAMRGTGVDLALEYMASLGTPSNWFPGHSSETECPRGHRSEDGVVFHLEALQPRTYMDVIGEVGEVRVLADSLNQDDTESSPLLLCRECGARWPPDPYAVTFE